MWKTGPDILWHNEFILNAAMIKPYDWNGGFRERL
jgi:hypothetical protein